MTTEFARLPNDEQLELLRKLAETALARWDLPSARVEPLKYRENAVFAVGDVSARIGVLRVHRPRYRTDAHIRSEIGWMGALTASGMLTPDIVRTTEGDVLAVVESPGVPEARQCDLLAWVDGQPLGTMEGGVDLDEAGLRATYRTVGEIAARIHAHGEHWTKPNDFARPNWDVEALVGENPTFGRYCDVEGITDEQLALLHRARDKARRALEDFGQSGDRYGLVHGDLVPDNILVGANGVRIVDFDDCGNSWYAFELATTVFPLLGGPGFEPARDGYVEGYRSVRRLSDDELAVMPSFLMARGLSYLGWPAGRPEMQFGRDMTPLLIFMVTDLAERYLADAV